MAIEKNKSSDEEEYHPRDDDTSAMFTAATTDTTTRRIDPNANNKAANILERLKRRNILIAMGIVIGIFCIYKIVDVLFVPSISRHKTTAHQLQAPVAKLAPQQPIANSNTVAPNNQIPIATATVVNRLNTLEQQNNTEQANFEHLSTQINDLQTALSNMDAKIAALTTSLQTITDEVTKQLTDQQARQAARRKAIHAALVAPKPIYYVKAMVPGRAWLATQDGGTVTVSLGNNLPGYGTVEVIDPNQGTLTTSSGAIIGYSPNDS